MKGVSDLIGCCQDQVQVSRARIPGDGLHVAGMHDEVAGVNQELAKSIYTLEELVVLCEWFREPPFELSRRDEDGFLSRVTATDVADEMGFDASNDSGFASSISRITTSPTRRPAGSVR